MVEAGTPITILMADDDQDDRLLTQEAFQQNRVANDLSFVENGGQLLDPADSPRPGPYLAGPQHAPQRRSRGSG